MRSMFDAFALGTIAQSSLLFAGLLVCWITIPPRIVGCSQSSVPGP
jgi:hypothetical protein